MRYGHYTVTVLYGCECSGSVYGLSNSILLRNIKKFAKSCGFAQVGERFQEVYSVLTKVILNYICYILLEGILIIYAERELGHQSQ